MSGFDARAWLGWLVAAAVTVHATTNPWSLVMLFGAAGAAVWAFGERGPEGRGFAFLVKIGLAVLALRVVLFALVGDTGGTVLFRLPRLGLPRWLGGFSLGGPVTAEVLGQSVAEGLRLAVVLAAVGAFVSVTHMYRVLRLVPRFAAEAALIVTIGVAFVPTMLRTASEIRDAQRLRGHRFRGIRSYVPLVTPVLAGALERSMSLAESMEMRGYGRRLGGAQRAEARARVGALASLFGLAAGGTAVLFGRGPVSVRWTLVGASVGGLAASLAALSRLVPRTRLRPDRLTGWDHALISASVTAAIAAVVASYDGRGSWSAYPVAAWPGLDLASFAVAALFASPVFIGVVRAMQLRRMNRLGALSEEPV